LRVPSLELGDRRREVTSAEADRGSHPQRAARHHRRSGHGLLGLVEIRQQLHTPLVERLPGLRQRKPARRPVQQAHAEVRLEVGHVPRDRRHRQVEPVGGARKATRLDDSREREQGLKAIHR
jgi:hypothetical protein